ncbi:phospholipase D family protein [Vibrio sp. S4M6]|uniref:phospholipase D-like domain-containing protein n=1 Tax=Vibrio sinus TaxID=2946865 RepID=UPI002029ECEE|nr:phospholipase D-like domain-containing protein [Vibrio sinus]MCL9783619.1 phospholipase D family protein [Vibrio sinus]
MLQELKHEIGHEFASRIDNRDALVFNQTIGSEPEQCYLAHDCIMLADRLAIITTYGIKPLGNEKIEGRVSNTMFAILRAIGERQNDRNFNFYFLYNAPSIQRVVVGKKTTISTRENHDSDEYSWDDVINTYNNQIEDDNFDKSLFESARKIRIDGIRCRVNFIAASPSVLGTHHNKYCINDNCFSSTLGASLGNKSKPHWYDSGLAFISYELTRYMIEYFEKYQLSTASYITRISHRGTLVPEDIDTSARILRGIYKRNLNYSRDLSHFPNKHRCLLFIPEARSLHYQSLMWINNIGRNFSSFRSKQPIRIAFEEMFDQAQQGDTIFLRNGSWGDIIIDLIKKALSKGCRVNLLMPFYNGDHRNMSNRFRYLYNFVKDVHFLPGARFELRFLCPDKTINDFHRVTHNSENDIGLLENGFVDHAKVYGLKSSRLGREDFLMTGTHNLDGQSFLRSHENMILVESSNISSLYESLFNSFWNKAERFNLYDLKNLNSALSWNVFSQSSGWTSRLPSKLKDRKSNIFYPDCTIDRVPDGSEVNRDEVTISELSELTRLIDKILPNGFYSGKLRSNRKSHSLIEIKNHIDDIIIGRILFHEFTSTYDIFCQIIKTAIVVRGTNNKTTTGNKIITLLNSNTFPRLKTMFANFLSLNRQFSYPDLLTFIRMDENIDITRSNSKKMDYYTLSQMY